MTRCDTLRRDLTSVVIHRVFYRNDPVQCIIHYGRIFVNGIYNGICPQFTVFLSVEMSEYHSLAIELQYMRIWTIVSVPYRQFRLNPCVMRPHSTRATTQHTGNSQNVTALSLTLLSHYLHALRLFVLSCAAQYGTEQRVCCIILLISQHRAHTCTHTHTHTTYYFLYVKQY